MSFFFLLQTEQITKPYFLSFLRKYSLNFSFLNMSINLNVFYSPGLYYFIMLLIRLSVSHSFVEIDHEIFSTVILSLPLIQEGQLSVSGERMCTILVNRLED